MNVKLPMCLLEWIDPDIIYWYGLCRNPSEGAMQLLEKKPDKINYWGPDKINWGDLSQNPSAIQLLEKNQDKIDWDWLSGNPSAMQKKIQIK